MKKVILGVAIASLAISCKKILAGGNKGVLRMEEGAERYNEDEMTDKPMEMKAAAVMNAEDSAKMPKMMAAPAKMDSTKIVAPTSTPPVAEKK